MKIVKVRDASQRFTSVLYGQPGSGKTYAASQLKGKTLIIDYDHGTSSIDPNSDIDVFAPTDMNDLLAGIIELKSSDYDNIILDTITALQNSVINTFSGQLKIKEWGEVSSQVIKAFNRLTELSNFGKNVIIIAQEKILNEDNPKEAYSTIDVINSVRNTVTSAARVIGRLGGSDFSIQFGRHPRRATKLSVFGVDSEEVKDLAELLELINK